MPSTPKIAPALNLTRPARACVTAPANAAVPTTRSEAVVAWCGLWPSRYTRAGTVRMDPPPPSAPRVSPISRPAARAAAAIGSRHLAGDRGQACLLCLVILIVDGHDRVPGRLQDGRSDGRAVSRAAVNPDLAVRQLTRVAVHLV